MPSLQLGLTWFLIFVVSSLDGDEKLISVAQLSTEVNIFSCTMWDSSLLPRCEVQGTTPCNNWSLSYLSYLSPGHPSPALYTLTCPPPHHWHCAHTPVLSITCQTSPRHSRAGNLILLLQHKLYKLRLTRLETDTSTTIIFIMTRIRSHRGENIELKKKKYEHPLVPGTLQALCHTHWSLIPMPVSFSWTDWPLITFLTLSHTDLSSSW